MAWVRVSAVAQLEGLLAAGVPRALHIVGAESVRSAAAMLHLLEVTHGVIPAEAVGDEDEGEDSEEEIGGGGGEDGDAGGYSVEVDDGAADADSDSDSDSDAEFGNLENWIVEGVYPLRRAARLASLLIEMDDVIPALSALAVTVGDVTTLHRLCDLGKDVHRCRSGLLVPGDAGELAVKLGNKTQKLMSHVFIDRQGVVRSPFDRARWISDCRVRLLNQVNVVLGTRLVLE